MRKTVLLSLGLVFGIFHSLKGYSLICKSALKAKPIVLNSTDFDTRLVIDSGRSYILNYRGESLLPQTFWTLKKAPLPKLVQKEILKSLEFSYLRQKRIDVTLNDHSQNAEVEFDTPPIQRGIHFREVQLFVVYVVTKDGAKKAYSTFSTDNDINNISGVTVTNTFVQILDHIRSEESQIVKVFDFHTHPSDPNLGGDLTLLPGAISKPDEHLKTDLFKGMKKDYEIDLSTIDYVWGVATVHWNEFHAYSDNEIVVTLSL